MKVLLLLIERMQKDNRWIRQNNQYIATLYEEIQAEKSANKKPKYDEQLLLLCGLPVYSKVLKKFAIKNLRMCGYGLRYGVFVAQNRFNIKID